MKDARLSLLLTEVIKIARLTSPFPDVPRQSSPRPRLRHGRRFALLSHPNLNLNLYTLLRSIAGSPSSSPNLPNCSSSRVYAAYLRSHFSVSHQGPCVVKPEITFSCTAQPRALWSLTRPSALLSLSLNFSRLVPIFPSPLPLAQKKLPIPC